MIMKLNKMEYTQREPTPIVMDYSMLTEIANDTTNQNILNAIEKKIFVTQLCGTKICFGLMGSI